MSVKLWQEPIGNEAVAREAHERQRRRVENSPAGGDEPFAQPVAHSRLVLDHLDVAVLAALGER